MQIKTDLHARNLGRRLVFNGAPLVAGICLHDTAGSGTHNDTLYLANPGDGRKVSVDFTVERDGTVYQLNPDLVNLCTWHCGRATFWKSGGRAFRNKAVTQVMIGIEIVHAANPAKMSPIWPREQIEAVADLCVLLCGKFNLTKDQITTHAKIITDGSRSDPRDFPFSDFWFQFNRTANFPAIDPPPGSVGSPIVYTVQAGDSLWKIAKRFSKTIEEIKSLNHIDQASNLIKPGQTLMIQR